ncbi:Rsd/AlgQ family anti-sigma factor [Acidiferrobacter thiooxydans]
MIERLLAERREMLVLFCRVAGLDPFAGEAVGDGVLQAFCQILVDYMAAAHFSLYQHLVDGRERRRAVVTLGARSMGVSRPVRRSPFASTTSTPTSVIALRPPTSRRISRHWARPWRRASSSRIG